MFQHGVIGIDYYLNTKERERKRERKKESKLRIDLYLLGLYFCFSY